MQNKTELVGISVSERLRAVMRANIGRIKLLGAAAMGLCMANSSVFGGVAPFGVAFCAALSGGASLAAALGAFLGYALTSSPFANMRYVAAVVLVAAAKWLFGPNKLGFLGKTVTLRHTPATASVTALFALVVSGAAVALSGDFTLYDLSLGGAEILLGCGATYFFARAASAMSADSGTPSKTDISCVVISLAVVLMGFAGVSISGLSVGRMLAILAILLCAKFGGEAGGAVAGITAGAAMGLAGGDITYVAAAYAFGGLVAGVFGAAGRLAVAASFVVVNAVIAFLSLTDASVYNALFEAFVASVIFSAMPQGWLAHVRPVRAAAISAADSAEKFFLYDRLRDVSAALKEIGEATKKVGEGLGKIETAQHLDIGAKVVERVCRRCPMKSACWQSGGGEAMNALNAAIRTLKRQGGISESRAPKFLRQSCCKLDEVVFELNTLFQSHVAREDVQRKVAQTRAVATDQFAGMSMMLSGMAEEITAAKEFDDRKAARVREYLDREGLSASRVQAYADENGRSHVSLDLPLHQIGKLHRAKSALDLCALLDVDFDMPAITAREHTASVVFTEKTNYRLELGAYQISGGNAKLCGDAYEYLKNRDGTAHIVLSDGMGSGGAAAVDSSMATNLIARLLAVGVDHEAALKMVNSALIIKSRDESLATLDIASVDLFTGRADFYKAGAAPTYLVKAGSAGYIESTSLPAGILRGVEFEKSAITLRENDVLVMVSDGVTATGADWVTSELESLVSTDMQRLCERLASAAKSRRTDKREDDITVIAAALRRTA